MASADQDSPGVEFMTRVTLRAAKNIRVIGVPTFVSVVGHLTSVSARTRDLTYIPAGRAEYSAISTWLED